MLGKKFWVTHFFSTPGRNNGGFTTEYWMFTEEGAFKLCAEFQRDYPESSFSVVISK